MKEEVTGTVTLNLSDIIDADYYEFSSMLSEGVAGSENRNNLIDLKYKIISFTEASLTFDVSGRLLNPN